MDKLLHICLRIKDLREFSDYTIEEFAEKLGIPSSEYASFESGKKDLPIGLIYKISAVLMIDPSVILLGKAPEKKIATVVYKGKGEVINRHDGYSFQALNGDFINSNFETMLVTIKDGIEPEPVTHNGQEFNYVIKGAIRLLVGEKEYYLRTGDSIYFDATYPHCQIAMDKIAKFITVIEKC